MVIKKKEVVLETLIQIIPFLKIPSKIRRAKYIIENYENVTPRNGKYNTQSLNLKNDFEKKFFEL